MGVQLRRGFGAVDGEREAFGEGMFNVPADDFWTYTGDDYTDTGGDSEGFSEGFIDSETGDAADDLGSMVGPSDIFEDPESLAKELGYSVDTIGEVLDEGSGGGSSSLDGSSDAQLAAAYAYGYERGQGDKLTGKPNNPTAAVDTVTGSAPSSSIGPLTIATKQGYAAGYADASAGKVDPKKPGVTPKTEPVAEGLSTGAKVAIGLAVGGVLAAGFMLARKRRKGGR